MVVETTSSVWKTDILTVVRLLHVRYASLASDHTIGSDFNDRFGTPLVRFLQFL